VLLVWGFTCHEANGLDRRANGLDRIAERLSDELGLERPDDLQHFQEKDLDELEWLKKVPRVKLLKLCQEVTAKLHSPDSSSEASKAPTPDARSVGSSDGTGCFESDGEDVLITERASGVGALDASEDESGEWSFAVTSWHSFSSFTFGTFLSHSSSSRSFS
jgi:hypothetical protein